jgi:hypothetical protein
LPAAQLVPDAIVLPATCPWAKQVCAWIALGATILATIGKATIEPTPIFRITSRRDIPLNRKATDESGVIKFSFFNWSSANQTKSSPASDPILCDTNLPIPGMSRFPSHASQINAEVSLRQNALLVRRS